jgi:uncharacterized OB-fold protein
MAYVDGDDMKDCPFEDDAERHEWLAGFYQERKTIMRENRIYNSQGQRCNDDNYPATDDCGLCGGKSCDCIELRKRVEEMEEWLYHHNPDYRFSLSKEQREQIENRRNM